MFLWTNKKNYPRFIIQNLSFTKTCLGGGVVSAPYFDHEVLSLNPARCEIQLVTVRQLIAQSFIVILSLSLCDLNNVERDVKH